MPSRASSTTEKSAEKPAAKKRTAKKAVAKKAAAKKATPRSPEARSGPVVIKKVARRDQLREQLHPGLLASALDLADGDIKRIEAVSYGSVMVTM